MSIDKYRQNWRQIQDAKVAVDQHLEGFRTCEKPSTDWKSLVFATGLILCALATFFLFGMEYAKAAPVVVKQECVSPKTKCTSFDYSGPGGTKFCWIWKRISR